MPPAVVPLLVGELDVQQLRSINPLAHAFVAAAAEAGHASTDDFNGPEQDGFGLFVTSTALSTMRRFTIPGFAPEGSYKVERYIYRLMPDRKRSLSLRLRWSGRVLGRVLIVGLGLLAALIAELLH